MEPIFATISPKLAENPAVTYVGGAVLGFLVLALVVRGMSSGNWWEPPSLFGINRSIADTNAKAGAYTSIFEEGGGTVADRKDIAKNHDMVDQYYDLSTDFYEFGWGQSFHFANRFVTETFDESILRHEHFLGLQLNLRPGMKVLDAGCGVGGPARNIARFTGANITGITLNAYQVSRGNRKAEAEGLGHLVKLVQGNFLDLPMEDNSFDAVYAIEATCHAPDRVKCFSEMFRVLKPGASFAGYEWVLTDKYDASNPEHVAIKEGIEVGDGLPELTHDDAVIEALEAAGFEVEAYKDVARETQVPWYKPFVPEWSLSGIGGWKTSIPGIALTHVFVRILEMTGLAPKGTAEMHRHLSTAAKTLRRGGELDIFTPMLFFRATKPLDGSPKAGKARGTSTAAKRRR